MKYRKKLRMKRSKRMFSKTGAKTHWKNVSPRPMRGGIRM